MVAPAKLSDLDSVFSSVISAILGLAGIVFVLMILMAGFNFLNAGTNRDAATKAQKSLTSASIGLVVVVSAWVIMNLLGRFLGITNFGNFSICIITGC